MGAMESISPLLVENIFNKAVELGLVETYTEQETQEGTKYTEVITANLQ